MLISLLRTCDNRKIVLDSKVRDVVAWQDPFGPWWIWRVRSRQFDPAHEAAIQRCEKAVYMGTIKHHIWEIPGLWRQVQQMEGIEEMTARIAEKWEIQEVRDG